jgi:hypothetical protein
MMIQVLIEKGENHCQVARLPKVSGGAVRHHLRHASSGIFDERRDTQNEAEGVAERGYPDSYKSAMRYVRSRYPRPWMRTCPTSFSDGGRGIQNSFVDYPLNVDKELAAGY